MYDLHRLGWHSFQQLCLTVTREILGQTVQSFLDTADGGRDGAFAGTWVQKSGEALAGRFVIQCKFTGKPDRNLRAEDVADEVEKARRLVQRRLCDVYILMTNAGLSGTAVEDIETMFRQAGVRHMLTFGSTWISDQIRENKCLRMMVPRVYGLGDLSQILDERAYDQAKALLASMREDLSKVVITSAYRRAAEALNKHGFVLLIGEPAAGKTTIASMLSMAALDQWGCSTLKLDDPGKVIDHWNPAEPESEAQFFWIDDAFGVMQYESFLVHGWNHALPQIKAMLRKGTKIVMTSRDYIYKRARNELKESAFPLLKESQVVIDVRDLTVDEREQILYNHIKLGQQPQEFRAEIKPYLAYIAAHSRFIPETARRLGDPLFTKNLYVYRSNITDFVERQEQLMQEVVAGLDEHSKAALGLIYMRSGMLESPIALEEAEREAIERLGSDLGGCITALECLDGSLVQHVRAEGAALWRFKHPTVGDAYASILLKSPELLGIYLRGSAVENLLSQVTCGDVGLERAVPLPKALFPLALQRLGQFSSNKYKSSFLASWDRQSRVDHFLTYRCSREFLALYIEEHPDILRRAADPGLMLDASSEVSLAVRLHELGLLPEEDRASFVAKINGYTFDGSDLYAIDNAHIQSVFTPEELSDFRRRLREELVPRLSDVRYDWQSNRDSDREPDSHIQPLIDGFESLKKEFAGERAILDDIDRQIKYAQEWIAETEAEDDKPKERIPRAFGDVDTQDQPRAQARSIFDDIDE
jgi:energy-coupling factor transporter ATP-binding protein EcfA2